MLEPVRLIRREGLLGLVDRLRGEGDLVRFRLGQLPCHALFHPEAAQHVLRHHADRYTKAGHPAYKPFLRMAPAGLLTSTGADWRRRRRAVQPAFHDSTLGALADEVAEVAEETAERWDRMADRREPFDVMEEMIRVTLAVITRSVIGRQTPQRLVDAISGDFRLLQYEVIRRASRMRLLPPVLPWGKDRAFQRASARLRLNSQDILRSYGADPEAPPLLDLLRRAMADEAGLSAEEAGDQILTMLFGGHETTASVLAWLWLLLDEHPDAERRMHQELDAWTGDPRATDGLAWTGNVIDEALRLYPPVFILPRMAAQDDVVLGHEIRAGSSVWVVPYGIHRNPAVWSDPDAFRPERFQEGMSAAHRNALYLPFSLGSRQCIGTAFAVTEMKILVAALASRFRIRRLPDTRVGVDATVTLRPRGARCVIERRGEQTR
ncbi:cytochrome P450 [Streptomyces apocyni]|uniref:cytochrome P450 n=1 Tax=Streptomyces apocyni TaxID=2654677 RepID=UPI0018D10B37|nr:cytochrome P450 [Streptomyces apocyni]